MKYSLAKRDARARLLAALDSVDLWGIALSWQVLRGGLLPLAYDCGALPRILGACPQVFILAKACRRTADVNLIRKPVSLFIMRKASDHCISLEQ